MRAWRRYLSTTASTLSQQKARPVPLRCRQIFEASQASSPSSPDHGSSQLDNSEIRVQGFVRSVRKQKRVAFAEISDGSTIRSLQAILSPEQASPYVNVQFLARLGELSKDFSKKKKKTFFADDIRVKFAA